MARANRESGHLDNLQSQQSTNPFGQEGQNSQLLSLGAFGGVQGHRVSLWKVLKECQGWPEHTPACPVDTLPRHANS